MVEDGKDKPLTSPSVTTVLSLVDKPALMQWAADKELEWIRDNRSLIYVKSDEDLMRWGRYRWRDVRDSRAEVGTGVHETIESLHTGGWHFPVLDDEQRRIMAQWDQLNERYLIVPHRSEATLWGHPDLPGIAWAGTADGIWDVTDLETGLVYENLLADIKTSRNTWDEHWMQVSALAHADVLMTKQSDGTWIEEEPPTFSGTALFHLREDKWEVLIETDPEILDLQYAQFIAYRGVWESKRMLKLAMDKREKTAALAF
jgi:hypothetical protein